MARPRNSEPRPLGELLGLLVERKRGWTERMAVARLREDWATVVGPQIAARCEPTNLFQGVLTVRAEGGVWATELTLLAASLAAKVNAYLGPAAQVASVKVTAAAKPPSGPRRTG